jgi:3-hydroxyisobutyrate dehydrogenase
MKVGFIGLGNMGGPMAANLVKAGHEVTGFDLSRSVLDAFAKAGGKAAATVAAAAGDAEIIITMLPAGPHVRLVYAGEGGVLGAARKDALLVDSSTIDVDTARAVTEAAGKRGFDMLDAPVSGGVGGAAAGTLTFMVGGSTAGFAKARPVLEGMGKTIVHAGPAGNGQAAKICNNMMLGISMIGVCEAFALADRLGLDRQRLFDISSKSSGQCWSMTSYCRDPAGRGGRGALSNAGQFGARREGFFRHVPVVAQRSTVSTQKPGPISLKGLFNPRHIPFPRVASGAPNPCQPGVA